MASTSSNPKNNPRDTSSKAKKNPKMKTRIEINSPTFRVVELDDPLPTHGGCCCGHVMVPGPGGPEDLPQVFNKVMNTSEGFFKSFMRMYDNLMTDGYEDIAKEIVPKEQHVIPMIAVVTGVIEEYADAGKTTEAMVVYLTLLLSNCAPNPYTYSVVIKAMAADPDPKFLEVAKECILEMMEKGWKPNARTCTAVFKAFALHEMAEEGKKFRQEMEAKGFVADRMAVIDVLKGTTGPAVKSIYNILFDDSEYSDSDEDDYVAKIYSEIDWEKYPPNSYLVPLSKRPLIENDPENPKDLQQVFNKMCTAEAFFITCRRMYDMLVTEGFLSQAKEIIMKIEDTDPNHPIHEDLMHTGAMEIYSKAKRAKDVLRVFQRMISFGISPNAYTYSVLIKALTKDPNFLDNAKQYMLEMMDNGMQPNARTYTAVFYAFARLGEDKLNEGKEFVKLIKARGFVAKKKAVSKVLKSKSEPIVKVSSTFCLASRSFDQSNVRISLNS